MHRFIVANVGLAHSVPEQSRQDGVAVSIWPFGWFEPEVPTLTPSSSSGDSSRSPVCSPTGCSTSLAFARPGVSRSSPRSS